MILPWTWYRTVISDNQEMETGILQVQGQFDNLGKLSQIRNWKRAGDTVLAWLGGGLGSTPSTSGRKSEAKPWCCRSYIPEGWIAPSLFHEWGLRGWEERPLPFHRGRMTSVFLWGSGVCVSSLWVLGMREIPTFLNPLGISLLFSHSLL